MSEAPPGDPCPPWPPGHRIGPFELRVPVWRGETAAVYAGWDCGLVRQVAVKEYLPRALARRSAAGTLEPLAARQAAPFERGLQTFVETARLLAHCEHPSLLRVHHLVQAHGTAYRVMPWHLGRRLEEVWRPGLGTPDEPRLRRLLDDLLGALAEYHRVAGAHGAVRGDQVLLQADGRALLLGPRAQDHAPGETPSPAHDLHDLARLARACIADAPPAAFGQALRGALEAAASTRAQDRPQTVAQFQQWLRGGLPPAATAIVPEVKIAPLPAPRPPPPAASHGPRWPRLLAPWAVSAVVAAVTTASCQTWRDTQHALLLARAAAWPEAPAPRPAAAATAGTVEMPTLPDETPAASAAASAPPAKPPPAATAARGTTPAKSHKAAAPSPRQACGTRTEFALYRCMQQQCARPSARRHPQCVRFRATDHPSD